jgi:ubiquinone/menaquinone biosynthesis C-methylase UbiE
MNNPGRQALQRWVEFPLFKRLGLNVCGRDVLEVGCGSGFGAWLLLSQKPASYAGLDFMPEQIELARKRLPDQNFFVGDAASMKEIPDASKDVVVIFGVLHHIPNWKEAVDECRRVLRPGGEIFVEEPDRALVDWAERIWDLGHPIKFSLKEFEAYLNQAGFKMEGHIYTVGLGIYAWKK